MRIHQPHGRIGAADINTQRNSCCHKSRPSSKDSFHRGSWVVFSAYSTTHGCVALAMQKYAGTLKKDSEVGRLNQPNHVQKNYLVIFKSSKSSLIASVAAPSKRGRTFNDEGRMRMFLFLPKNALFERVCMISTRFCICAENVDRLCSSD